MLIMNNVKIFAAIARAEEFAKNNGVTLEVCKESFIDDKTLDVNDYANDTELMSMQYKGYLVNVYIGSWDSFEELGSKWIDYDIFYNDYELMNEDDDICETNDVLEAATDIEFYMHKIENIIKRKEV
jgi:hypothetical protein